MNTIEIKKKLIDEINASTDTEFLEGLYDFLVPSSINREVYQLNEKQVAIVEESREQIKKGEFLTNEESIRATEKWLGK